MSVEVIHYKFRRIFTRYDKLNSSFLVFNYVVTIAI